MNLHLQARGVRITTGTIVDATILHAPTSTKNREQQRDPEMHQTKKGNQWYFGMKAHVGVDSKTKIIHTAVATAANVADSTVLADLLHGEETRVWGDQAYRGQTEVIRECAPRAQDHTHRRYRYKNGIDEEERAKNRTKSSGAVKGGAPVSGDEAEIRICEGALPRTEEERASAVCHLCVGQSVSQSKETAVGDQHIDEGKPLFALRLVMAKAKNSRGVPSPELLETCNTLHRSTRNLLIQIFLKGCRSITLQHSKRASGRLLLQSARPASPRRDSDGFKEYQAVGNSTLYLGRGATRQVLSRLAMLVTHPTLNCSPSEEELAKWDGLGVRTVKRAIARLKADRLIFKQVGSGRVGRGQSRSISHSRYGED